MKVSLLILSIIGCAFGQYPGQDYQQQQQYQQQHQQYQQNYEQYQQHQPPAHIPNDVLQAQGTQHQMNIEHGDNTQQEDRNQFLGKERAEMFETLTPEQSIARLRELVRVIDRDQDQVVTLEELRYHLDTMHRNFIQNDVARNWAMYPEEKVKYGGVTFPDYIKLVYDPIAKQAPGGYLPQEYEKLKKRDERRWQYADLGKDGTLIQEEYACFLHPQNKEPCPHMRDVIALEAKDDIDKDSDGYVDLTEFIAFIYNPQQNPDPSGKEPDWVEQERQIFKWSRDKNRDGVLDLEEIKAWIVPEDFNKALMEGKHLVQMADDNKDGRLSIDEMVAHYEVFVGSKVPKQPHGGEL